MCRGGGCVFVNVNIILDYKCTHVHYNTAIAKSDLRSQLDLNHNADPNQNYNILSSSLKNAKNKHIPKKLQRFNRRKHL